MIVKKSDLAAIVCVWLSLVCNVQSTDFWFLSDLKLSALASSTHPSFCDLIPELSRRQRKLCRKQPDAMRALELGVQTGVNECQTQFAHHRWNCTVQSQSAYGKLLVNVGSREAAFVHAITSAGVVHSVARACALGDIRSCTCASPKRTGAQDTHTDGKIFRWGGCSDNLKFAASFARRFLDANERNKRDGRALMNLHNNKAGRKVGKIIDSIVKQRVRLQCKCHGVSGSCTTRTCWQAVEHMHELGVHLRHRYITARQVTLDSDGKTLVPSAKPEQPFSVYNHVAVDIHSDSDHYGQSLSTRKHKTGNAYNLRGLRNSRNSANVNGRLKGTDLVYFESSPDYCDTQHMAGSLGTGGRRCNVTSSGTSSCDSLCCGRGYNTQYITRTVKCNCKFVWCCEVRCEQCVERVAVHTCKHDTSQQLIHPATFTSQSAPAPLNTNDNNLHPASHPKWTATQRFVTRKTPSRQESVLPGYITPPPIFSSYTTRKQPRKAREMQRMNDRLQWEEQQNLQLRDSEQFLGRPLANSAHLNYKRPMILQDYEMPRWW